MAHLLWDTVQCWWMLSSFITWRMCWRAPWDYVYMNYSTVFWYVFFQFQLLICTSGTPLCVDYDTNSVDRRITLILSLQLFDLIYREETLFNVIKSVTRNGRSILLTALLALILVYLFSIVGFLYLKNDFIMEVDPLRSMDAGNESHEPMCPIHCKTMLWSYDETSFWPLKLEIAAIVVSL